MFCPKCGTQAPDNAAFCAHCGNKFENTQNSTPSAGFAPPVGAPVSQPQVRTTSLKLPPVGIAAAIVAAVAVLFSIAPWFDVSQQMLGVAGLASGLATGLSAFTGSSAPTVDVNESYAVWGLISLADAFKGYAQAYASFGGSKAAGAVILVTVFSWGCLLLWLASLVFTVWGCISAFTKGNLGILRIGSILMIATIIVFYIFAGALSSDTGNPNAMPVICLILSIVALVCTFTAKKKA